MTLVRWKPLRELVGCDDYDCWLDGLRGENRIRELLVPPLDVEENERQYVIRTEVPGVPREGLQVTVENGVLTIRGEKKEEHETGKGTRQHRIERSYGSFHRTLLLPDTVDHGTVEGVLKDGVLTITLTKKEETKPRQVQVNIG